MPLEMEGELGGLAQLLVAPLQLAMHELDLLVLFEHVFGLLGLTGQNLAGVYGGSVGFGAFTTIFQHDIHHTRG